MSIAAVCRLLWRLEGGGLEEKGRGDGYKVVGDHGGKSEKAPKNSLPIGIVVGRKPPVVHRVVF